MIVAIVVIVGIYYFYSKSNLVDKNINSNTDTSVNTNVSNNEKLPLSPTNSMVTNSTYTNSEYNFKISYPKDWIQKPFTYTGIAKVSGGIATLENTNGSGIGLVNSSEGCYGYDWNWVGTYFRKIKCVQVGSKMITIDAGITNENDKAVVDSIINSFSSL